MPERITTKTRARKRTAIKYPPKRFASAQAVDTEFEYEGNTFVRRRDGVHLVISPPSHEPPHDWAWIQRLALSFDGYERLGSFDRCAELANEMAARYAGNGTVEGKVDELRAALFFEQRRHRHMGWPPEEGEMAYIRALVDGLRRQLGDDWVRSNSAAAADP